MTLNSGGSKCTIGAETGLRQGGSLVSSPLSGPKPLSPLSGNQPLSNLPFSETPVQPMTPAKDHEFNEEVDLLDSSNGKVKRRQKMRKTHGQFNLSSDRKLSNLGIKTNSNFSPLSNDQTQKMILSGPLRDNSITQIH